jgi:excisionase family DNA binding protein
MLYFVTTCNIDFDKDLIGWYTGESSREIVCDVDDLLTTRQLQDLLQVDRITIYRMLNDGRLRGFKVGGQWRFSRQEIEHWLQEQRTDLEISESTHPDESSATSPSQILPLSCVQAIQGVCAEALNIAAVTLDLDGKPMTDVSNSCDFCNLILSDDEGHHRCVASWMQVNSGQVHACHAGLLCASAPIEVNGQPVATIAGCQFASPREQIDPSALATSLGLDEKKLCAAAGSVRTVPNEYSPRIARLLQKVAYTFTEIGQERLSLLSRLQHIAEVSKI